MKTAATCVTSFTVILELNLHELQMLRAIVQNAQRDTEPPETKAMREQVLNALQEKAKK